MIEPLIHSAKSYLPTLNESRLRHAFEYAQAAHNTQLRKDGTPYISHPIAAAEILTQLKVDEDTLVACLLHDVPEDTDRTIQDIEKEFGPTVSFLVEGITKLSKVHYRNKMASRQIESLKKLFLHSAQDPRIILIKLADRLHNMGTIEAIPNLEKRERIARETMEIFVPIANLLGVWQIKHPLEDACFKVLHPEAYESIVHQINQTKAARGELIKESIEALKTVLDTHHIEYESIKGRKKNLYSIFRKMKRTGKSFSQIYDLIGLRVIVQDVGTCYRTLGAIHQSFTPKIGRLKDFIAIPKSNGYQSIHTTIFGVNGAMTEIQIRTMDMHLENEYGIAAHYFYREEQQGKQTQMRQRVQKKYEWVQKILDLQRNIQSNDSFMKHLKLDIFEDRIFVFTPKGDVVDLPVGATVIDFTYHIHSDLGLVAVDADINGVRKDLTTRLKNGDVVLVHTSEESPGPQVKWLDIAKTNLARTRIKEYLRERDRNELIMAAETLLERKLEHFTERRHYKLQEEEKLHLLEHFRLASWEDLLINIGNGTVDVHEVMASLFDYEDENSLSLEGLTQLSFTLEVEDRVGMLGTICNVITELGVNILRVESVHDLHPKIGLRLNVEVSHYEQFEALLRNVSRLDGVHQVIKEIAVAPLLSSTGAPKKP